MRSLAGDALKGRVAPGWGTGRRVLPRVLRKPARILSRMEWRTPRHLGLKGLAVFVLATTVGGIVLGDHTRAVASAVTAASGLAIDRIKIAGQSESSEVEILDRLAVEDFSSLFTFDVDAARERVETLPWVAQATLKKLYPDTLQVAIVERLPYARWQIDGTVSVVDPQGRVITEVFDERYAALPLVAGPGANTRVDEYLSLILAHPTLAPKVRGGVLISERRWNIVLADAVEIMLPGEDPAGALGFVVETDAASQLLSRDIEIVDVRSPDLFVVRLSERGLLGREAILEEREKSARQTGVDA